VEGEEYDALFGTHSLEHKTTSVTKQVAFDALACDGSGNYLKCTRAEGGGWRVEDFKARSYKKDSKAVLTPWVIATYSEDNLTGPPPLTEDTDLLSFKKAGLKARALLKTGIPEVCYPLGYGCGKVLNYKVFKASAFVFRTPGQRAAVVKQILKFQDKAEF
jgi:hypothetical protein